ncbi:hypothetical protein BC829DRAFT_446536 [Chytridium lagenaria]|nr:hypothetical protein BC829DRAFT_446536 [Chytridium lagenaria]
MHVNGDENGVAVVRTREVSAGTNNFKENRIIGRPNSTDPNLPTTSISNAISDVTRVNGINEVSRFGRSMPANETRTQNPSDFLDNDDMVDELDQDAITEFLRETESTMFRRQQALRASPWWTGDHAIGEEEDEEDEDIEVVDVERDPDMAGYEEEWETEFSEGQSPDSSHVIHVDLSQILPNLTMPEYTSGDSVQAVPLRDVLELGVVPITPDDGLTPQSTIRTTRPSALFDDEESDDSIHHFAPRPLSPLPGRRSSASGFGDNIEDDDGDEDWEDEEGEGEGDSYIGAHSASRSTGFWYDRQQYVDVSEEEERLERRTCSSSESTSICFQCADITQSSIHMRNGLVPPDDSVQIADLITAEVSALERRRGVPDGVELEDDGQYLAYHANDLDDDDESEFDEERILEELRMLERELRIPDFTGMDDGYDEDEEEEMDETNDFVGPL